MADKATTEIKLTPEQIDQIILHSEYVFCCGEDPANELPKEEDQKGWVDVLIPFTGLYYTGWTDRMDIEQEYFVEELREGMELPESMRNREEYITSELITSKGWRNFLDNLQEEDIPAYMTGKKTFTFWIPCAMKSCYEANLFAMLDALEHTILKGKVDKPKDWKFEECHHPKEYNFTTDKLDFWVREEVFKEMCRPEVFESKWFKAYAKHMSTPCSGYIPYYKYDQYFDTDNWYCREGVLLFWVALGLYSKEHFIAPVKLEDVNELEDDLFDEKFGFGNVAGMLEQNAMDDWYPEFEYKEAY